MSNQYQQGGEIKRNGKHWTIVLDKLVFDTSQLTDDEFVFSELKIKGKVLYFVVNFDSLTDLEQTRIIGFWHHVFINNFIGNINWQNNFKYRIGDSEDCYYLSFDSGNNELITGFNSPYSANKIETSDYEVLSVSLSDIKKFSELLTPAQKGKRNKAKSLKLSLIIVFLWLVIVAPLLFWLWSIEADLAIESGKHNKLLAEKQQQQESLALIQGRQIKNNFMKDHLVRLFAYQLNGIALMGDVDFNESKVILLSHADEKLLSYVALKNDFATDIQHNFKRQLNRVTWSIND